MEIKDKRRIVLMNGEESVSTEDTSKDVLTIGDTGITAKKEDGFVIVANSDKLELFRFNDKACSFDEQPIRFLIEVYHIGFNRGKMLGKELLKADMYKLLKSEI